MYERYHELLEICFKAKEKGIDVFFEYTPCADNISIRIYKKGWIRNIDPDKKFSFYIDEYWKDSKKNGPVVALEAIAYINELLEEEKEEDIHEKALNDTWGYYGQE